MYGIMLLKAGYKFPDREDFKKKVMNIQGESIEVLNLIETLGRADYVIIFKAKNVEAANDYATKVRKIEGISDSENIVIPDCFIKNITGNAY